MIKSNYTPKFDKHKCAKCKYHGSTSCGTVVRLKGQPNRVHCDYAFATDCTCLKPGPNNTVIDMRGDDYDNCKLFVEGKPDRSKVQINMGKRYEDREREDSRSYRERII